MNANGWAKHTCVYYIKFSSPYRFWAKNRFHFWHIFRNINQSHPRFSHAGRSPTGFLIIKDLLTSFRITHCHQFMTLSRVVVTFTFAKHSSSSFLSNAPRGRLKSKIDVLKIFHLDTRRLIARFLCDHRLDLHLFYIHEKVLVLAIL